MLLSLHLLFRLLVCKPLVSWSSGHRSGSYWGQLLCTGSFIPQRSPHFKHKISIWEWDSPFQWGIQVLLEYMMGIVQCFGSKHEMFRVCQFSSHIYCLKALTLKALTLLWADAFTAFCLLLYIPFSYTSDSKIHKATKYFSTAKSKTNKSLHTNLSPSKKSLKFQAIFSLANGLSVFFQRSFQVHQTIPALHRSDCSSCALHWC